MRSTQKNLFGLEESGSDNEELLLSAGKKEVKLAPLQNEKEIEEHMPRSISGGEMSTNEEDDFW